MAARLAHPHIVRLIDSGESDDGILYTVFEYIPGTTLKEVLAAEGKLSVAEAVHLLAQVLVSLGSQPAMPLHAPAVLNYAVYGLVLVLVMLFLPDGVLPAIQDRLARRRAARSTAVTAEST